MLLIIAQPTDALTLQDISVTQEGNKITLLNPNNNLDFYELNISYIANISNSECNNNNKELFTDNDLIIYEQEVVLYFNELILNYCFKISDSQKEIFIIYQVDQDGRDIIIVPEIKILRPSTDILSLDVNNVSLNHTTWRYATFKNEPNCLTADLNQNLPTNLSLRLHSSDYDQWFCFKVANLTGQYGYAKYRLQSLDQTPPTIFIDQKDRLLTASANEVIANWSYVLSQNNINCNTNTFINNLSIIENRTRVSLNAGHVNSYFCFKAVDNSNNAGFYKYQVKNINFNVSNIQVTQKDYKLMIDASNLPNAVSWRYLKFASSRICNHTLNFNNGNSFNPQNGIKLDENDHNYYFCIRATDNSDNYSFGQLRVDTTGAKINLKLEDNVLTASSNEQEIAFMYLKSKEEIACVKNDLKNFKENNFELYTGNTTTLYDIDNDSWICFQATDNLGNLSYKRYYVENIATPAPGSMSTTSSDGDVQAIIIGVILSLSLIGGSFYYIFIYQNKTKKELDTLEYISPPKISPKHNNKNQPSQQTTQDTGEDVEPLDYLK